MLECFDEEGVCDSHDDVWPRKKGKSAEQRYPQVSSASTQTAVSGQQAPPGYLRSLSPGGVLLKFTVVDGKIGPVVTTVPQRGKTAVTTDRRVAIQTSQRRDVCLYQVNILQQCFVLLEVTLWRSSRPFFFFLLKKSS